MFGMFDDKGSITFSFILMTTAVLFKLLVFIPIAMFFKHQVKLVLDNLTTIEERERQRNPQLGPNIFDLGSSENFKQVFGMNTWIWPFPVRPVSSSIGNGLSFPQEMNPR